MVGELQKLEAGQYEQPLPLQAEGHNAVQRRVHDGGEHVHDQNYDGGGDDLSRELRQLCEQHGQHRGASAEHDSECICNSEGKRLTNK